MSAHKYLNSPWHSQELTNTFISQAPETEIVHDCCSAHIMDKRSADPGAAAQCAAITAVTGDTGERSAAEFCR